jgi:uncharacterized protein (DUF2147 family)
MSKLGLFALLAIVAAAPLAAQPSPAGQWRTISDDDGKPRALVEVREVDGRFVGTVKALLADGENQEKVCDKCSGDRKDQRIVGMEILRGLRADGNAWSGGEILDPKNGKTYKAKMQLEDDGKKLVVRGFIGVSLLGRSQTWLRASP